ncbi:MAG TPA: nucleotidyl transferase AbiEii/AbiGii toxin family protein, partial [Chloroflexota bacterium]
LARVAMPNVEQHGYRAYPLVDHIADKLAAMFERYGTTNAPSIRYKDLVDLVAIVTQASVPAAEQFAALKSEAQRRGISLPGRFTVPERELWESGYAAEAQRSLLRSARTLDEALAIVTPFVDPLLDGGAGGVWDRASGRWST